ncbi:MAG TPA: hypothetical protein VI588_01575 [Candidatus Gracilibacteria bacterium]|nr:hypothetical protein [Candidatus Gracilibacteria bacterium]
MSQEQASPKPEDRGEASSVSVPPAKPEKITGRTIAKAMVTITGISVTVAFTVKRVLGPLFHRLQPENPPFTFPEEVGYSAGGAAITAAGVAYSVIHSKRKINRRDFFIVAAGGAGAAIGDHLARTLQASMSSPPSSPPRNEHAEE